MCFGSKGNKTTYTDAEALGPKNDADGGFTQRNNKHYRKQIAGQQDPSAVTTELGGSGKRKSRNHGQAGVVLG